MVQMVICDLLNYLTNHHFNQLNYLKQPNKKRLIFLSTFFKPVAGIEANSNFLRDYYQVVDLYDYLHNPDLYNTHI